MSADIANHSNRGLSELIESWIAEEMARSPVRATVLGFDGYDDQLGSFAEEDILAEQRANHTWHDRFEAAAVPEGDDALARFGNAPLVANDLVPPFLAKK